MKSRVQVREKWGLDKSGVRLRLDKSRVQVKEE